MTGLNEGLIDWVDMELLGQTPTWEDPVHC